jgi:hypothetical protein
MEHLGGVIACIYSSRHVHSSLRSHLHSFSSPSCSGFNSLRWLNLNRRRRGKMRKMKTRIMPTGLVRGRVSDGHVAHLSALSCCGRESICGSLDLISTVESWCDGLR